MNPNIKRTWIDKILHFIVALITIGISLVEVFSNLLNFDIRISAALFFCGLISISNTISSFGLDNRISKAEEEFFQKLSTRLTNYEKKIESLTKKVSILEVMLQQKLYSLDVNGEDEEYVDYCSKKITEFSDELNKLHSSGKSKKLSQIEYYSYLHKLADKVEESHNKFCSYAEQTKSAEPKIWACTCFNSEEWNEGDKEKLWTSRLTNLSSLGIKTERLCIISSDIQSFIALDKTEDIISNISSNSHLKSFIEFLKNLSLKALPTQYIAFIDPNGKIERTKGFFGIFYLDNKLSLVQGDCFENRSTAYIVFQKDAQLIYDEFETRKNHASHLKSYLQEHASPCFISYLENQKASIAFEIKKVNE